MTSPNVLTALVVASTELQAAHLERLIQQSGLHASVTKCHSHEQAEQQLLESPFDVCLLHDSIVESEQIYFMSRMSAHATKVRTAMIPVSRNDTREALLRYIKAGAHGILIAPARPEAVQKVISTALASKKSKIPGESAPKQENQESITSLPWILETVAAKLERVSTLIEAKKPEGEIPASSKLVKETLLGSIAGTPEFDEQALLDFVDFLVASTDTNTGKN